MGGEEQVYARTYVRKRLGGRIQWLRRAHGVLSSSPARIACLTCPSLPFPSTVFEGKENEGRRRRRKPARTVRGLQLLQLPATACHLFVNRYATLHRLLARISSTCDYDVCTNICGRPWSAYSATHEARRKENARGTSPRNCRDAGRPGV